MGRLIKYTFIFYTYETKGVIFSGVKNIVIELNDPKERINTDTDEKKKTENFAQHSRGILEHGICIIAKIKTTCF